MDTAAAEWMNELALNSGMGGVKDKSDKDAIWVGELTDNLTVAIALREWDKAVALVEEGNPRFFSKKSDYLITQYIYIRRNKKVCHTHFGAKTQSTSCFSYFVPPRCSFRPFKSQVYDRASDRITCTSQRISRCAKCIPKFTCSPYSSAGSHDSI